MASEETAARGDYDKLHDVLMSAFQQASAGKGKERHANGRAFEDQPIMEIGRMVGPGFAAGQAMKKVQEAIGMVQRGLYGAAQREMLGAIVYTAAAHILIDELPEVDAPELPLADEPRSVPKNELNTF